MADVDQIPRFPLSAGLLLGVGLGGFFDGVVAHQLLQWHHMATSAGYPPDSVENLKLNTRLDGLFHAAAWVVTVAGLLILWRDARRAHGPWSFRLLAASLFMGWGLFNLVEGVVDHHLLGLHHVNETAPREQWIWWDLAFLAWGALMAVGGGIAWRRAAYPAPAAPGLRAPRHTLH